MEYNKLYVIAEELITTLTDGTETGRKLTGLLYNTACYVLDRQITAWYKSVPMQDRVPFSDQTLEVGLLRKEEDREEWVRRLRTILKIPWILPIYSYKTGLPIDVSRRIQIARHPTCLVNDIDLGPNDPKLFTLQRGSLPPPDVKLIGLATYGYRVSFDQDRLDYVSQSLKRETYSASRTAILDTGAMHARNIPSAGFLRGSDVALGKEDYAYATSFWMAQCQGAMSHKTPLGNWIDYKGNIYSGNVSDQLQMRTIAYWRDPTSASLQVDALYYQLFNFPSWNYLLSQVNLRAPRLDAPPSIVSNLVPMYAVQPPRRGHSTERMIFGTTVDTSMSAVMKLVKHGRAKERIRKIFNDKSLLAKWLGIIIATGHAEKAAYDPSKVRYYQTRLSKIKMTGDLDERKLIYGKMLEGLTLKDHFYYDTRSGVQIFCEHIMEEARLLSIGAEDMEEVKLKYSDNASAVKISGSEIAFADPRIIECKYCGADLGSIWYVVRATEESYNALAGENFLDDDVSFIVVRLMASHSIITDLSPLEVSRAVKSLVEGPLNIALGQVARSDPKDRLQKEKFLYLSSIVSVIHVIWKGGAPLELNLNNLEKHLSKEYIDIFGVIGIQPSEAITRMLTYWGASLSKFYSDPESLVTNTVSDLLGDRGNDALRRYYKSTVLHPLKVYGLTKVVRTEKEGEGKATKTTKTTKAPKVTKLGKLGKLGKIEEEIDESKLEKSGNLFAIRYAKSIGESSPLRIINSGSSRTYSKRESRVVELRGVVPMQRLASYGVKTSEEVFLDATTYICPELLLHPESSPFEDVLMSEYSIGQHIFGTDGKCTRCGLIEGEDPTATYTAKYRSVVEKKWKGTSPPVSVALVPEPSPLWKRDTYKDDPDYNRALVKRFGDLYGWQTLPDPSLSKEIGYIMLSLGYLEPGEVLIKTFDERKMKTAWNRFIDWALTQKDNIVRTVLVRLRSGKAEHGAY
jgi:hypothetical protein